MILKTDTTDTGDIQVPPPDSDVEVHSGIHQDTIVCWSLEVKSDDERCGKVNTDNKNPFQTWSYFLNKECDEKENHLQITLSKTWT